MARRTDTVRELQALIDAQAHTRDQMSKLAQAGVQAAFAAVDDWTDPKQTGRAVTSAVKAVQTAQRRTASVTDGYLARSTTLITGRRSSPVGAVDVRSLRRKLPQDVIETLAGAPRSDTGQGPALSAAATRSLRGAAARVEAVDPADVYGRVPDGVRFAQVAKGLSPERAARQGLQRAAIMADTDVMLADRAQITRFLTENKPPGVIGYRRILHPELGGGGPPCGLCVVAADRLYHIEDLMPLHARCRCSVAVATRDADPGQTLNQQDLAAIYRAAGGNTAARLKSLRVETTEHGELGPILVNASQHYRGPREFARTQSEDLEVRVLAELEGLQDALDKIIHNAGRDRYADEAIAWHRQKIKELGARLP